MYYRADDVALYVESQTQLNPLFGLFNTLLMLTSSWFVALGVHRAREDKVAESKRWILLALGCGLGFIVVKVFEYGEKFEAGINIVTNDFFMYYFLMTGIHLLHVIIGIGVLTFLWNVLKLPQIAEGEISAIESGASFWHLVDILWIVLFALLYLLR